MRRDEALQAPPLTGAFRSDQLAHLRDLLREWTTLREMVGPIAQFDVVVDANFLLGEVRWMILKKRNPSATTDLRESIIAGTIIGHVTQRVIDEVESYLQEFALETNISLEAWLSEWLRFKALLRVHDPNPHTVEKYLHGCDPDDAPTLALAEELSACGILSRDPHIKAMGGDVIPKEFVTEARDYSRKMAVYVSIHVSGYFIAAASIAGIRMLIEGLRVVWATLCGLPTPIKAVALIALICLLLNPKWRDAISRKLHATDTMASEAVPAIIDMILCMVQTAKDNKLNAPIVHHV